MLQSTKLWENIDRLYAGELVHTYLYFEKIILLKGVENGLEVLVIEVNNDDSLC